MSASTMKQILAQYNEPYKKANINIAPPRPVAATIPAPYYQSSASISRPALKRKPQSQPTSYNYSQVATRPYRPVATGEGLYRLSVSEQVSSGYSVQLGMFEDYDNLLAEVKRLDDLLRKEILVHVDRMNGKKVYKVLVGDFNTKDRAISYRNNLTKKGLNGFIRDLSLMK
jgi:rare lipoprotein A